MFWTGKIHGGVVTGCQAEIGLTLPEAYRIGLEFGEHEWFTQVTAVSGGRRACFADLLCPYCGGPTWRDPDANGYVRGFCWQCAQMFGTGEAMDGRTHFQTPTLAPGVGKTLQGLCVPRNGGSRAYPVNYHWRPGLYDENDDYLVQSGTGQTTNAPRWFARHVNEVGDGLGFGRLDTSLSPALTAGHDLEWFGALPEVARDLGVTQMKLVFGVGYIQAEDVTVELVCRLLGGGTETVRVVIPAGTAGPSESQAISDVVRVKQVGKWTAERRAAPYPGSGLYVAVTEARVVEPAGATCEFVIVNDAPLLASADGAPVVRRQATPAALQLGVSSASGPHLMDDAVGQLFVFYAREGEVWMRRRAGLPAAWREAVQITSDGDNSEPCAEKDDAGRLRLLWQHGGDVRNAVSVDDGAHWVEV